MLDLFAPYMNSIITVIAIYTIAVITPGPDFVMVLRNTLSCSKRAGLFTALGSASGMVVHASYTVLGLGILIKETPVLFNGIRTLGGLYLIYIGWRSIMAKADLKNAYNYTESKKDISSFTAWRMGFLTDILNPMVVVLLLSIFSTAITDTTPVFIKAFYVAAVSSISLLWFVTVTLVLSQNRINMLFKKAEIWIDRLAGLALMGLGIKIIIMVLKEFHYIF